MNSTSKVILNVSLFFFFNLPGANEKKKKIDSPGRAAPLHFCYSIALAILHAVMNDVIQ
jgi:hypothetical protein